ncbi:histidine kinase [Agromyces sp. Root81]|uniref:sensor histidine kinase n=1 Tax=Agromyces sp. Root81 TaxID=1736601 RepID=UPI0006F87BD1|nr:ATP-binding protein [Agromyces sp. Root81]KRC61195.1 histidine kinase [Agromyces sp. Root81]
MKRFRIPLRARLTLVYGAMFLIAGAVAVGVTWALVRQQLIVSTVEFVGPFDPAILSNVAPTATPTPGAAPTPTDPFISGIFTDGEFAREIEALRDEALAAIVTQGMIAVVLVGALAAWLGWLVTGRMLRPISTITDTARRIAESPDADRRMHERIGLTGPRDEITELADTFDGMLARLDTSFDAQRRFIANASHELRTPLTLNRALLEVSMHRPDASSDVKLLGETLLEVNARHERLIDGLLLLARSERELPESRFVDLADVVEHVGGDGVADESGVTVELVTGEAPTSGDPVLLEHLVRNLLENGVRHNVPEGGWVRVETRTDADGRAALEVSNSGPVVPPYELGSLFEPFRRLEGERMAEVRGVGLGLSVVRSIVQAHDGEVALAARPEGGLVVTVTLPGESYGDARIE